MDGKVVEDHEEVGETPEDDLETGKTEKQQTEHVVGFTASKGDVAAEDLDKSEKVPLTAPESGG